MNATDIELTVLEELLNDECKCECLHTAEGNETCSGIVTHISTFACGPERFLICFAAARFYVLSFGTGDYCEDCFKPVEECWSVRPV